MSTVGPALVVLAAGASTRLGRAKALVPIAPDGRTALARLLAAGVALGDPSPLVVVGAHAREIAASLAEAPHVELLVHANWAAGRTGSLQAALARRAERDLCIAPVDVPDVPAGVFAALADRWSDLGRPARGWLAPEFHGRFGHPIVVGRALLAELKAFPPDRPLRDLRALAAPLSALSVSAREVLDDVDTPGDLARLRRRRARE